METPTPTRAPTLTRAQHEHVASLEAKLARWARLLDLGAGGRAKLKREIIAERDGMRAMLAWSVELLPHATASPTARGPDQDAGSALQPANDRLPEPPQHDGAAGVGEAVPDRDQAKKDHHHG